MKNVIQASKKLLLLIVMLSAGVFADAQSSQSIIDNYFKSLGSDKINDAKIPSEYRISDEYADNDLGISYVYIQQTNHHIPFYTEVGVFALRDNQVAYYQPDMVSNENLISLPVSPVLTPSQAIMAAASLVGESTTFEPSLMNTVPEKNQYYFNVPLLSNSPIMVQLVYAENTDHQIFLSWNVSMDMKSGSHWWNVQVDAIKGGYVNLNDYVASDNYDMPGNLKDASPIIDLSQSFPMMVPPPPSASPSYLVFKIPTEAPSFAPRDTTFNPADPTASPFGWHDTNGAAGAEFFTTKGNNTTTVEDADANNTGGASPSGGANNDYDFPFDPSLAPVGNQDAALTNLFYVVNRCHDLTYLMGFTPAAGNFQVNNYGLGGLGNDPVNADGLDGSGTNNANFSTPVDGSSGRMQMYRFTYTTPNRDGDFDNGVICHEFGHGVSNRLTGGPSNSSCLGNGEQGGEGWSDWLALVMTIKPTDLATTPRGMGTYVIGQATNGAGIRRFPYCTDMSINPQTYSALALSNEVHNIGEIWCDALWDMTWFLIADHGFDPNYGASAGNTIALKLVLQGMKLQPCSPGFLDARDAILAADNLLYGGANACSIWKAFARRGMGYYAVQGSNTVAGDETQDFSLPPACIIVTSAPTAAFNAPSTGNCGSSIHFSDVSVQPASFLWNFGDGTATSTVQNPNHVFSFAGTYSVKLKVTNALGADSIIHSITITSTLATTASSSPTSICNGSSSTLSSVVTGGNPSSNYVVTSIPYAPVAGSGTSVTLGDDATSAVLNIGFTFNFFGNNYTQFYICSNGFITFSSGQGSPYTSTVIPTAATPNNMIAMFWNDLNPGIAGSFINYFTTGLAPNRQLIINYHTWHYNGTSFPYVGQIILNETVNSIELHTTTITAVNAANSTTQGIENSTGTIGFTVPGRNHTNISASNDAYKFTPGYLYNWTPGSITTSSTIVSPTATTTYTLDATDGSCHVTDTARVNVLPVQTWYQDFDGDTYGNSAVSISDCFQPVGYVLNSTDCNDNNNTVWQSNSIYIDVDGDGYDNGQSVQCYGNTAPTGYSLTTLGSDCNDNNNTIWQSASIYIDADGDGYDNGQSVQCYGNTAPTGYSLSTSGSDCNDNNNTIHATVNYYVDGDNDGYGSATVTAICSNTAPAGYSTNNTDCNDANGAINPHGAPYSLSITNLSTTAATLNWQDGSCNYAISYRIRRRVVGSSVWTYSAAPPTQLYRSFSNLTTNTTYETQVRATFGALDSSNWSPLIQFTTLLVCDAPISSSVSNITNNSAVISWVGGTYGVHIVQYRSSTSSLWSSVNVAANQSSTVLNSLTVNTAYVYRIRTKCSATLTSGFTPTANFSTTNTRLANPETNNADESTMVDAMISPNPNEGEFEIGGEVNFTGNLNISIMDITGRIIFTDQIAVDGFEFLEPINISELPAGMYLVNLMTDDAVIQTLRVIKQ